MPLLLIPDELPKVCYMDDANCEHRDVTTLVSYEGKKTKLCNVHYDIYHGNVNRILDRLLHMNMKLTQRNITSISFEHMVRGI